ncbi:MAG TPA: hypothetical protein VFA76_02860 [Terriglobales bacterium]|nr:hypothetical protein [Terriglobales bacterium]
MADPREQSHLRALSQLTLNRQEAGSPALTQAFEHVARLDMAGRAELVSLADSHHVLIRALQTLQGLAAGAAHTELLKWAADSVAAENARIDNALRHLDAICRELEAAHCQVVVMKSLDHWPDLGNDLDLFTSASEQAVVAVMREKFNAHVEPRSWGDRLANKWNFAVPGLREAIEVHAQRLGQTGEHTGLAQRVIERRTSKQINSYRFLVPAPEERVIIATLQRMYRHFYFRICDVVDTANLVESGALDYPELRRASEMGGIWPGVATFLVIVSDYVEAYRGKGLPLPSEVLASSRFGGDKITVRSRFLRFPLMPEGASLYTRQVTSTARRGDIPATLRLSLLPPLASAAALAYRVTGSDKGIW